VSGWPVETSLPRAGQLMCRLLLGAGRARGVATAVIVAALLLATLPTVTGMLLAGRGVVARADDVTTSQDDLRTGWDPNEPGLSPSVVSGGTFGQVFSTAVNGQVYAQPLVVGSTVIVATENDWVYALDAATGAIEWSDALGTPYPMSWCSDLQPNIGDTSAPVYDPSTGTVYVLALVKGTNLNYHLFGINIATGAITYKHRIVGSPANDPGITFNPKYEGQRPGLLLMNGWVYAAFASHCDVQPYVGFVAGWNLSTKATTLWSDESGVTYNKAGIWQSGGGLMSDGPGRIFFTSGNGVSPPVGPGTSPPGQLAESTVRLRVRSDGSLVARDFFSPKNAPSLDSSDLDFGAGGPVGLPYGTTTYPHVLVQAGKDGRVFVLNRDSLGGRGQGPNGGNADLSKAGPYAGEWGHPAMFEASTSALPSGSAGLADYVYYLGKKDFLRTLQINVTSTGKPVLADVANSTFTFGYTSGSPVVTSNGTDPASAVVWVVNSPGASGTGASLQAFDALPQTVNGTLQLTQIWSAPVGTASKFSIPATSNGMVYVGTRDGHLLGFGVTAGAALGEAKPVTFGQAPVGATAVRDVTVTAAATVTVTGVSATAATSPDPFAVGPVTETGPGVSHGRVTFPVTLRKGDALHAQVSFSPAAPGGAAGGVAFTAGSTALAPVNVPLYGEGTQAGFYATTSSLSFALVLNDGMTTVPVPVGVTVAQETSIVNGGTSPQTVTSVSGPGGPFNAIGLPRPGTVIKPGQSIAVTVTYTPGRSGPAVGSFTIKGTRGTSATVTLSGTGQPPATEFTATPAAVNFGHVRAGHTARAAIDITNTGNQPSTLTGTSPVEAPFHVPLSVPKGLPVNSGEDLKIPITFTPARPGTFTSVYLLTWTDQFGTHTLKVPITGTG
jgi:hypothetical protein